MKVQSVSQTKSVNAQLHTTNSYSKTTALLRQKGCTLNFAMTIGGILEFAVPLFLKSHISYYLLLLIICLLGCRQLFSKMM